MNSRARFLIDFVSFLNLFYIAISTSLQVGFDVKMNASLVGAEVCSLLFSIFVVISSLRTPVMVKGESHTQVQVRSSSTSGTTDCF